MQSVAKEALVAFARSVADELLTPEAHSAIASSTSPRASIVRGALGNALYLAEVGRFLEEPRFVAGAARWLDDARALARRPSSAWGPAHLGAQTSLNGGSAGISWTEAVVADAAGDRAKRRRALTRLADRAARVRFGEGIMTGAAGFAEAAGEANDRFAELDSHERSAVASIREVAHAALLQQLRRLPAAGETIGIALGTAGTVFAALRSMPAADTELAQELARQLDWLSAQRRAVDEMALWPAVADGVVTEGLPLSWCNGVTGMFALFTRAGVALDRKWLFAARDAAAAVAWMERGNPTLCCGVAGRALTLLDFARVTSQKKLEATARSHLRYAIGLASQLPPSLFVGKAGIAVCALAFVREDAWRPIGLAAPPTARREG